MRPHVDQGATLARSRESVLHTPAALDGKRPDLFAKERLNK